MRTNAPYGPAGSPTRGLPPSRRPPPPRRAVPRTLPCQVARRRYAPRRDGPTARTTRRPPRRARRRHRTLRGGLPEPQRSSAGLGATPAATRQLPGIGGAPRCSARRPRRDLLADRRPYERRAAPLPVGRLRRWPRRPLRPLRPARWRCRPRPVAGQAVPVFRPSAPIALPTGRDAARGVAERPDAGRTVGLSRRRDVPRRGRGAARRSPPPAVLPSPVRAAGAVPMCIRRRAGRCGRRVRRSDGEASVSLPERHGRERARRSLPEAPARHRRPRQVRARGALPQAGRAPSPLCSTGNDRPAPRADW